MAELMWSKHIDCSLPVHPFYTWFMWNNYTLTFWAKWKCWRQSYDMQFYGHYKMEISFIGCSLHWKNVFKCHHRRAAFEMHMCTCTSPEPASTFKWTLIFPTLIKPFLWRKTGSQLNVIGHWKIESLVEEEPAQSHCIEQNEGKANCDA